jgi:transcriptional regulator with XRE-family HTH domain
VNEQTDLALAAAVKQLREERDITQEELAHKAGITVSSLSRIERGLNSPGWITVSKIIEALGVSLGELVEALEYPPASGGAQNPIRLPGTAGDVRRPADERCRHVPR